jgi:hypothetical protein
LRVEPGPQQLDRVGIPGRAPGLSSPRRGGSRLHNVRPSRHRSPV